MTVPSHFSEQSSSSEVLLWLQQTSNGLRNQNEFRKAHWVSTGNRRWGWIWSLPSHPQGKNGRLSPLFCSLQHPALPQFSDEFSTGECLLCGCVSPAPGWHTQQLHVLRTSTAPLTAGTKKEQQQEEQDGRKMCLLKCHAPF